jgi:selenocysteine lyase/cysteine desulfurase
VFAVTACANATGERPPFEALLALAADAGALTVLDAAQSVGHAVPDLSALACDFMAFSGHKMYGPMGTGALVGRRTALERLEPLRYGGDMVAWVSATEASFAELPMRLEGGTPNVAGAVGLAAAADFIDQTGRARSTRTCTRCAPMPPPAWPALPGVTVLSAETARRPSSRLSPRACTRTTSARCSTNRALPCAPATTARSRCWTTWAWGRPPGPRSRSTTRTPKSSACWPAWRTR